MKKRLLTLILTIVSILMCIFGLSACKDDGASDDSSTIIGGDTNCEHLWSDWTEEQEATCKTTGLQSRICTLCEGKEEKIIEKTAHKYNSENTCEYCGVELAYTSGLVYEKPNYYANYYVVKGIGTATETDIVIPAQHAGYPVKSIASEAFYGNDRITSVTAPSIIEIEREAFYYCAKLHSIELNSIKTIGYGAFKNCKKLNKITLSKNKLEIGNTAFLDTEYFNNNKNWKDNALYISEHLISVKPDYNEKTFTIKSDTLSVADFAFENVSAIETIQFPENEILIGSWAFSGCDNWKEFEVRENIELIDGSLSGTSLTKLVIPVKYAMDSVSDNTANVNTGMPNTLTTLIITKSGYSYYSGQIKFSFSYFQKLEHLEHPFKHTGYHGLDLSEAYKDLKNLKTLTTPGCVKMTGSGYGEIGIHIGEFFSSTYFDGSVPVTTYVNSKKYTYYFPAALKEITIDGGYVNESMFYNCDNFETITIKNLAQSEDNNIGSNALSNMKCKNLILDKSVNYIYCNGKYENGQRTYGADNLFYNGTMEDWLSIKRGSLYFDNVYIDGQKIEGELIIPNGITEIPNDAFNGFNKISSIKIPDSVTKIGINAFLGTDFYDNEENWENGVLYCGKYLIKSTGENKGNTGIKDGTLIIADGAFRGSENLPNELSLPNSLIRIGEESFSSTGLIKLTIGENVQYIGKEAFANTKNLKEIKYNAVNAECFVEHDYYGDFFCGVFCGEGNNTEGVNIIIGKNVKNLPAGLFGVNTRSTGDFLNAKNIIFEEESTCESIGDYAFYNCRSLTSFQIPKSVKTIGTQAFRGCTSLANIYVPSTVTNIKAGAFSFDIYNSCGLTVYCDVSEKPNEWGDNWNGGCPVVWDCKNNDVAEDGYIYTIVDGIRYGLKDGAASVVEQPGNIITANIPTTINYNNKSYTVTSIKKRAFYQCDKLLVVSIPNTITKIESDTFRDCDSLTNVTIPSSVTSIGTYAFYSCSSLTNIVIPNSVTSIGEYAFSWCRTLTNIVIPNSVTTMGRGVFYQSELITISCEAITKPNGWNSDWNSSNRPVVWGYKE